MEARSHVWQWEIAVKLLKDPFLHFVVIGALLFVTYLWVNPASMADHREIVVDAGRIEQLIARFERTWNRAPSDEELKGIIDNFIVEEIHYRQALTMGLDNNDSVIRRRLRQKLEFLTMEATMAPNPGSPAQKGPDFRYCCPQNTPRAWKGRQKIKIQKLSGNPGVKKVDCRPKSGFFLANVRNVARIIFSLLENYVGP